MYERLKSKQVEVRGCEKTRAILGDKITPATEEDYQTEYNDYILAVKVRCQRKRSDRSYP